MSWEAELKELGEVCSFQRGLTYAKGDEVDLSKNVVLRANNISMATNALDFAELKYIKDSIAIPESKLVRRDTLMICTASGSKSHLGKVAYVDDDYGYAFGGFMGLLVPEREVRGRYLYYAMLSEDYKEFIDGLSDGVNINNLKWDDLKSFTFPVPPLPEQQRIVGKLDAAFAALGEAEGLVARNRANARELFESYLNGVFEGKGDGWVRLNEVCEITSKLVDPRQPEHIDLVHVGGGNIESKTGKLIDLKTARDEELKSGKFLFDESMVLYNKIRPYLVKVVRPTFSGLCSADMYPLHPKAGRLDRDYLYYALLSNHFTEYAIAGSDRAGMPKVNREHLFAYEFPLPSLKEQQRIAKSLDALLPETQALEATYQQKLTELSGLKKAVLGAAFRGEL